MDKVYFEIMHSAKNLTGKKKRVRVVPCEIYSRVVGYYRPVSSWNQGKQWEFWERKEVKLPDGK